MKANKYRRVGGTVATDGDPQPFVVQRSCRVATNFLEEDFFLLD
ncbi:hypothetical protein Bhyg_08995 [Pseudolycoriella hygida]|uniref:Uncharacterized protein n=1 Tax=Pseudolycoriella hygida TaxID=35572 RepID=A0A9Q0N5Q4_9DIPT|nr:hypothetical protein Bhyg_08995 [Pseudolycoriella hygida]